MQNVKIKPMGQDNNNLSIKEKSALMKELMELEFAIVEFTMYLDNHPQDMAALATFRDISKQKEEVYKLYVENYGPLRADDVIESDKWLWGEQDFPWDTGM